MKILKHKKIKHARKFYTNYRFFIAYFYFFRHNILNLVFNISMTYISLNIYFHLLRTLGFSHFATKTNVYCSCVYDIRSMLIPMELNFFDTNLVAFGLFLFHNFFHFTVIEQALVFPFGNVLKHFPSKIDSFMNLCVSKCYEHRTEAVVVIAIAIRTVEIERTCIGTIPIIAATYHERIVQPRKVRVVQFNPKFIYFKF